MWKIEGREVIRVGDKTTHGGHVITGSSTVFYEKIPIARVGDKVTCPKCEGTHTIVEGAPMAFDEMKNIARHGDAVSCGAKLISRSSDKQGGGFFSHFFKEPEVFPGRGLSKEEYCKVANAILANEKVIGDLKEMAAKSAKEDVEYSAWIVENSPGEYSVTGVRTDNDAYTVIPGEKPENAVSQVHTHLYSAPFPSDDDIDYYHSQQDKCFVYFIMDSAGQLFPLDDEGNDITCK